MDLNEGWRAELTIDIPPESAKSGKIHIDRPILEGVDFDQDIALEPDFSPKNKPDLLELDMKWIFQKVQLWSLQGRSLLPIGGF